MTSQPNSFARTKRDGLSFDQWFTAYNAERLRLGLSLSAETRINGERYDLNEAPAGTAECDRAQQERMAEGWEA